MRTFSSPKFNSLKIYYMYTSGGVRGYEILFVQVKIVYFWLKKTVCVCVCVVCVCVCISLFIMYLFVVAFVCERLCILEHFLFDC